MGSFKCILYLTLVAGVFSYPKKLDFSEMKDFIDGLHGTCTNRLGVTDDQVKNYQFSDKSTQMMCYMKCLLVEAKWFNEKEELSTLYAEQTLPSLLKGHVMEAVHACKNYEVTGNECETSYNFNACLAKYDPENYFLP